MGGVSIPLRSEVSEPPEFVRNSFGSLGKANFIGMPAMSSGVKEDADERSDRRLLVLAADFKEGSELADDTAGDSRPASIGEP